ncbi:MAG: hypothetical protein AAGH48_05475 [Pseudomonadota bacterium]
MGAQPFVTSFNNLNGPASGNKAYCYALGTTTLQTAYTDSGLATPATNPVIANAAGQQEFYLNDTLSYTIKVYSFDDATLLAQVDYPAGADSFIIISDGTFSSTATADTLAGHDANGAPIGRTANETKEFLGLASDDSVTFGGLTINGVTYASTPGTAGQTLLFDGAGNLAPGTISGSGDLLASANLSDLSDAATALGNLGVSAFGRSLLDDANAAAAQTTLGLGSAATADISSFGETLIAAANASTARTNLELGSAATQDESAFASPAIRKSSGSTHTTSANSWTLLFGGRVMTGVFLDAANVVTTVHSHVLQIERADGVWVTLAEA